MKFDWQSKIIIGVFGFFVLFFIMGNGNAASVDVGGWTFTIDAEGWRTWENPEIETYDPNSEKWIPLCYVMGKWEGVVAAEPFFYPAYPNAPKETSESKMASGIIGIYVLEVPDDLRTELQNHDITVYGSVNKIPEDRKNEEMNAILKDATANGAECTKYDSEKDITFNDRKAHLSEGDNQYISVGAIAILLDNSTVGIIDVYTEKEPTLKDEAPVFNGRAWDIIEKFTVSKK
jgi:hypothetical protein